jgi:hypothetical protein
MHGTGTCRNTQELYQKDGQKDLARNLHYLIYFLSFFCYISRIPEMDGQKPKVGFSSLIYIEKEENMV